MSPLSSRMAGILSRAFDSKRRYELERRYSSSAPPHRRELQLATALLAFGTVAVTPSTLACQGEIAFFSFIQKIMNRPHKRLVDVVLESWTPRKRTVLDHLIGLSSQVLPMGIGASAGNRCRLRSRCSTKRAAYGPASGTFSALSQTRYRLNGWSNACFCRTTQAEAHEKRCFCS